MDTEGFDRSRALGRLIAARIARLSPPCRRILALASVLGRELDLDALEALDGNRRLPDLLAEARSAGIIAEVPGDGGRLRFAHALVRDACYESLSASARAGLHRRAADVLGSLASPDASEIAYHLAAGARDGDRLVVAERLLMAGHGALRSLAFEEAARLCRHGLDVLGDPPAEGASGEALRGLLLRLLEDALGGAGAPSPP